MLHPTSTCFYLWVPHVFPIRHWHHDRKLLLLLPLPFHIASHEGASHPVLAVRVPAATRCMSFLLGRGSEGTQAERQREAFGELERHQGSEE